MPSLQARLDAIVEKLAHSDRPQTLAECIQELCVVLVELEARVNQVETMHTRAEWNHAD